MLLGLIDRIGDWNPQFLREVKGRWNVRNVAIAVGGALLGYLFMFFYGVSQFNRFLIGTYYVSVQESFCRLQDAYLSAQKQFPQLQEQYRQLQAQFARYSGVKDFDAAKVRDIREQIDLVKGKMVDLQAILNRYECPKDQVDMALWWQTLYTKMFGWVGVTVLFVLLVVGTYMLISNFAREERDGTMNFIRFSPQSASSILLGKLLGVPILLYLAAALMVPAHLWLGLSAKMPLLEIVSFWTVLAAGCVFFYSAALLFAFICPWLGGFQSWLGSGAVFLFLCLANGKGIELNPGDWLNLFSPSVVLPYLFNRIESSYGSFPFNHNDIQHLQWFNLPVGMAGISLAVFAILNYALWTGWIWQSLNRCFHNPNITIVSKRQSYWLVACFAVELLGFAVQNLSGYLESNYSAMEGIYYINIFNFLLFVSLIAILSPHRQTLQDWARYRRESGSQGKGFWHSPLVQDLLVGEKSPAVVAIGINLAIATTPFLVLILLWPGGIAKINLLFGLAFCISLVMICATFVQIMLMMKTPKRSVWTTTIVAATFALPPIILGIGQLDPAKYPTLWIFSTFPWVGIEYAGATAAFMAFIVQLGVLGLLNIQLTRKLKKAGESQTKALLSR